MAHAIHDSDCANAGITAVGTVSDIRFIALPAKKQVKRARRQGLYEHPRRKQGPEKHRGYSLRGRRKGDPNKNGKEEGLSIITSHNKLPMMAAPCIVPIVVLKGLR